jgi:hypothetical protein
VQGEDSLIDDTFNISATKDGPPLGEAENDLIERSNLSMGGSDASFSSFSFDEGDEIKVSINPCLLAPPSLEMLF